MTAAAPAAPVRRLRLGMVGGGEGAFIGAVHRMAARLDDRYELVAGALSSDAARNARSAAQLHIASDRAYADFRQMARAEAARSDGIDVVAVVTPNDLHVPVAQAFLDAGIHVICDKPLAATLAQARALALTVRRTGLVFALTHAYSAYPMVRLARQLVRDGTLGTLRLVQVEYAQDWLATPLEHGGHRQAAWRTDPARAGAGCLADIGCHAFHLAGFVSGLEPAALCCDAHSFVAGRAVEDNAHVLLRYAGGARGALWASQVATGERNALRLRVYGTAAALAFDQEAPDTLQLTRAGGASERITRGGPGSGPAAACATRLPAGHPEGLLEAFAQIYREAADLVTARRDAAAPVAWPDTLPGVDDGVAGMAFIDAALRSAGDGGRWVAIGDAAVASERRLDVHDHG